MRRLGWIGVAVALVAFAGMPSKALAQPRGAKPAPAPPAPPPRAAALPGAEVTDLLVVTPSGITAEHVGATAAGTSYSARAAEATADAAEARVDVARALYLPRLTLLARYTRLSDFTLPLFGGPGSSVITFAPPGTVDPPTIAGVGAIRFPMLLNQYLTQAQLTVPISDYFFRIGQSHTSATKLEEAARYDSAAARAKAYSDGKIAYFTWLRARGARMVAEQSYAVAMAHQKDAENLFSVGSASKADVLRAQTTVAVAELAMERAKSGLVQAEAQIRVVMHGKAPDTLSPGEPLDGTLAPLNGQLSAFVGEAHERRPELKSLDRSAEATRKLGDASSAAKYPSLSAFGEVTYANPNLRKFPQVAEWFPTWSVGVQATWSPNDLLLGGAGASGQDSQQALDARAAAIEAQKAAVRDAITLEVTQAYQGVVEADAALLTTARQLEAAVEGYRVARELFNAGRGTGTTLIDAETALTQARVDNLNARVDARVARIKLEHAVGRDIKGAP